MTAVTRTLELFLDGERLRYRLRGGKPSEALLAFLSRHKVELADSLKTVGSSPENLGQNGQNGHNSPDVPHPVTRNGDSVHSVHSVQGSQEKNRTTQRIGRTEETGDFLLVNDPVGLGMVAAALDSTAVVGVDTETTGLHPQNDRVRLLCLACDTIDGGAYVYLVDCFAVDPTSLWELLAEKELVLHNAVFDLGFLARMGLTPAAKVNDTMLLSRCLYAGAGEQHGLADCVRRELGKELPKEMQRADWSGTLTEAHMTYAARDAAILRPLLAAVQKKIAVAKLERTAKIEERCLPAVVWMASNGVAVDQQAWRALARNAEITANRLRDQIHVQAPKAPGELFPHWNLDSPADVTRLFSLLGITINDTTDETLAGLEHPVAGMLRQYREATKRLGTYGEKWLKHVAADGRVYPSWNQLGAEATGRMSCSGPNMQQIPRDPAYRRCIAAPAGRVLVKADYSQIELRIAAKVSGDKAMLKAYLDGEDLHTRTARNVLGVKDVTKEHRQVAKSLNFGLLYGMGAPGLRQYAATNFGVKLTEEEAGQYRAAFFKTYPGLRAWHQRIGRTKDQAIATRTLTGRHRRNVTRFTEKLNTPVQGTGADGLKLALSLLWERREQMPGAFPVLVAHDEIVVEADAAQADAAAAWLRQAMVDAMAPLIDPVPVEVEVQIGRTWGG
jgi:DNA polymerase-1